jgi:hypothetical protein
MSISIQDFKKVVWSHYLEIEKTFIETFSFVAFDDDNAGTFSEKYFTLYQLIGSEIDVVAKELCALINPMGGEDNIHKYCQTISTHFSFFVNEDIRIKLTNAIIKPWSCWSFSVKTDRNGVARVNGTAPTWWKLYNKTKHQRTQTLASYGKPFYKYANQKNVRDALAGLFQLNIYVFMELCRAASQKNQTNDDYVISQSALFDVLRSDANHRNGFYRTKTLDGVSLEFFGQTL